MAPTKKYVNKTVSNFCLLQQAFTAHFVSKAASIYFIEEVVVLSCASHYYNFPTMYVPAF